MLKKIYKEDKDKKSGRYYVVPFTEYRKAKESINNIEVVPTILAGTCYRSKPLFLYTDNNLALKLKD